MEGISIFISILAVIWSILSIILFFKVWGMTNDVRELKEHFIPTKTESDKNENIDSLESSFKVGDHVTEKGTLRELVVCDITSDGKYVCRLSHKQSILGTFSEEELRK